MPHGSANAPRLFYLLAVLVGLCGLPLAFAATSMMVGRLLSKEFALLFVGDGPGALLAGAAVFAAPHALMGAAFGYAWPGPRWRWGVWLTAGPVCLLSFVAPTALFFAGAAALTTLPACAGAHAAAHLYLRRAGAARPSG